MMLARALRAVGECADLVKANALNREIIDVVQWATRSEA
jgi:hypothetical protein